MVTKLIAHRGLLEGPSLELENQPAQIEKALAHGFDVEVDIWYENNSWMLGHDAATYCVSQSFLSRPNIWIHCKNHEALFKMTSNMHYFWHENDAYTITSEGFIWAYPGKPIIQQRDNAKTVNVLPERNSDFMEMDASHTYFAICSDFVLDLKGRQMNNGSFGTNNPKDFDWKL